ncbi:MAG: MarR family transcriptional regulator [Candidatus Alcyoniella australis]|nr:MarR family transcriptional regulator [Candidatus Alcyoniella australis]
MDDPEIRKIQDLLQRMIDRYLEAQVLHGRISRMPSQQVITLSALGEQGMQTMSCLADGLRLAPSTLTGIIDRLIERGFVERRPDPEDRRVVRVQLSRAGKRLFREITAYRRKFTEQVIKHLNPAQLGQLLEHLEAIAQGMERELQAIDNGRNNK